MDILVKYIQKQDPSEHESLIEKFTPEITSLSSASSDLVGTTLNIISLFARNQEDQEATRKVVMGESPEFDIDVLFSSQKISAI